VNWKVFNTLSYITVLLVTFFSVRVFFETLNGVICLLPIMVMLASALIRIGLTHKN
jgi:hypothetical protein